MKQALINMLSMQDKMNTRVHDHWAAQNFEWYRAIWIECGELIEHYGYKWWKKQVPDLPQVQLEVIDIWHFGLSALFHEDQSIESIATEIERLMSNHQPRGQDVRQATEALALDSLNTKSFSVEKFCELMTASGMSFDNLYCGYVGKNVLNFFRQDHGYKDGTYVKNWGGREDNEHLVELVSELDQSAGDFADAVYAALDNRYQTLKP